MFENFKYSGPLNPPTAHVIGSRGLGGAEMFYVRLVRALHALGHPVLAVCPPSSGVSAELATVPKLPVRMSSLWDIRARWKIPRGCKRAKALIIQTYMGRATRLTHLKPTGGIVHVARLGGYYDLAHYRHAHAWIANTRGIYHYLLAAGFPSGRVFHIGNFVEPAAPVSEAHVQHTRGRLCIPRDAWVLVSAGRLHPNKAFDTLIDALAALPPCISGRPLHLVIVGAGPLDAQLRTHARSRHVTERTHFVGWQRDLGPYYGLADVFVCPSRIEPLGNVILEAWSHDVPVVSTASAGGTELIQDDVNGRLVPVDDGAALAAAIHEVLESDPTARSALAQAGRRTLEAEYSRDAVLSAYLRMYEILLQDR